MFNHEFLFAPQDPRTTCELPAVHKKTHISMGFLGAPWDPWGFARVLPRYKQKLMFYHEFLFAPQDPRKPDSVLRHSFLCARIFGPPECVVITDRSPVAAGGIANVSPIFRAEFRLTADDRLCGSLNLSIQISFLISFETRTPDLTTLRLHGVPCILLSGLSSPPRRGEYPGSQGAAYSIYHICNVFH